MEKGNDVVKGKCLIFCVLLMKKDTSCLQLLLERKFFNILDKYARLKYKYTLFCLQNLIECIVDLVPKLLLLTQ